MIIKKYTYKRHIICYIRKDSTNFAVCTGKPSDASCIAWHYSNLAEAEKTANEFYNNYLNF